MTANDRQLLIELEFGRIDAKTLLDRFSVDIKIDSVFIRTEVRNAISTADPDELEMTLALIWLSGSISRYLDILNDLLIDPNHSSHQQIAKSLQDSAPSPTTVPYIRIALESGFDYLEYTGSDSGTIAKWFSWLLFSIGTPAAIALMNEYSNSPDEGVRNEMQYRLKKIPA